jgi:nifR3 family TIM-barrel protein
MNFWKNLQKPIMALAPMANVTDAAFRRIIAKYGKPDVAWTEFVSVEGLLSEGRAKLLVDFWYAEAERPIVAQIFGSKPEQFTRVAAMVRELGFDGIDINMGCPDRGVERSGGGAALIKDPGLAVEIIAATKRGAEGLPVSVKTRLGYNENAMAEWLPRLLAAEPAALTLHLRTRQEMSDVPAHWELAGEAVAIRNAAGSDTVLLGNGDVPTVAEARAKISSSGLDGVMIGRGIFGNPWLFSEQIPTVFQKLSVMLEHTDLFQELFHSDQPGRLKSFDVMKKHYKAYANGFDGAKELRGKLMQAENAAEVRATTEAFLKEHGSKLE